MQKAAITDHTWQVQMVDSLDLASFGGKRASWRYFGDPGWAEMMAQSLTHLGFS